MALFPCNIGSGGSASHEVKEYPSGTSDMTYKFNLGFRPSSFVVTICFTHSSYGKYVNTINYGGACDYYPELITQGNYWEYGYQVRTGAGFAASQGAPSASSYLSIDDNGVTLNLGNYGLRTANSISSLRLEIFAIA